MQLLLQRIGNLFKCFFSNAWQCFKIKKNYFIKVVLIAKILLTIY